MGEETNTHRSNVHLRHPLERGVVCQWEEMELVWNHAYRKLRADPQQQPVLVTESVLNPLANRRRTVETLLETHRAPAVFVADTPSLCLYTVGSTTGLVLESGYSATYAVPIIEGSVLHSAVTRLDLGGNDLTVFLLRLVESRGSFFAPAQRHQFAAVKEKLCRVALDYDAQKAAVEGRTGRQQRPDVTLSYNLAGETLTLQLERFQCPESLFQPSWLRVDAAGVDQLIHTAINRCPADSHQALYNNVLLAGGCTCFPGFRERLGVELSKLCPEGTHIDIQSPGNPKTLAWRGGSEFCLSPDMADKWITLKEYREEGVTILDRKRGVLTKGWESQQTRRSQHTADDSVHKQSQNSHHPMESNISRTSPGMGDNNISRTSPGMGDNNISRTSPGMGDTNISRTSTNMGGTNISITSPGMGNTNISRTSPGMGGTNISRTSPGMGGTTTPCSAVLCDRRLLPSETSVPCLDAKAAPRLPQSTTPGFRGGKLFRGTQSPTHAAGHNLCNQYATSLLHVHKVSNDVKAPSLGTCRHSEPIPRCPPQTATALNDDGDGDHTDESVPLNSAAKCRRQTVDSNTEFASFRKLSLFDHLLDEVSMLGSSVQLSSHSQDSDDNSWPTHQSQDNSLLTEDELLPGHGLSSLRRSDPTTWNSLNP